LKKPWGKIGMPGYLPASTIIAMGFCLPGIQANSIVMAMDNALEHTADRYRSYFSA
jgi:hypothetical protein